MALNKGMENLFIMMALIIKDTFKMIELTEKEHFFII
jgi:hypothetical protein